MKTVIQCHKCGTTTGNLWDERREVYECSTCSQKLITELEQKVECLKDHRQTLVNVINAPSPTIDKLQTDLEHYKKWVDELQSGLYINCVFCGHCYGPRDDPTSRMADVLKRHVENCPEHPMSKLKREIEELKSADVSDAKYDWHFTETELHPPKPGLKPYEHVDCLIIMKNRPSTVLMRPWNCEHLVWDDADYDDFFCETGDVLCWTPILEAPDRENK